MGRCMVSGDLIDEATHGKLRICASLLWILASPRCAGGRNWRDHEQTLGRGALRSSHRVYRKTFYWEQLVQRSRIIPKICAAFGRGTPLANSDAAMEEARVEVQGEVHVPLEESLQLKGLCRRSGDGHRTWEGDNNAAVLWAWLCGLRQRSVPWVVQRSAGRKALRPRRLARVIRAWRTLLASL